MACCTNVADLLLLFRNGGIFFHDLLFEFLNDWSHLSRTLKLSESGDFFLEFGVFLLQVSLHCKLHQLQLGQAVHY